MGIVERTRQTVFNAAKVGEKVSRNRDWWCSRLAEGWSDQIEMFAFALWDIENKKLVLARDPFGIKPLYYSNINNVYYFASQIKSLLSINDISSNKNKPSIIDYYLCLCHCCA